jgi:cysteine desulfurase / selenocysteine lyase
MPAEATIQTPGSIDIEIETLRRDFPILDQEINGRPLIYFDNAATSQKPRQVIDALVRYYEHDNANVHRGVHELSNRATEAFESARTRAAEFVNAASADEIVFTSGTTESINLVASSWGNEFVKEGDVILLTEMEHHSNLVPWQMLAARTGAKLRFIPVLDEDQTLDLSKLDELMTPEVRILSIVHISNALGVINPVAEICAKARKLGIVTLVDAAQSAGHCPLDVQAIGCDFLAVSGHKMCAPTGVGFLYGRKEILDVTPPYRGGGEMIDNVDYESSSWNVSPHKFEAGTPNICGPVGLHAAMDYLDAIGRDKLFAHDQELSRYAYERLSEIENIRIFGPAQNRAGVVTFVFTDAHAHDLVTLADRKGLALRGGHHCTQPLHKKLGISTSARASFYIYNTHAEIDRMVEILREIREFLV